ncbi:MAG: helicase-exonuclease AddAB subunit AddB [Eubacteriales bacterium]|nr:helicase-exonuclease AddAB subunit AddB [Eubacteriales bacterium]
MSLNIIMGNSGSGKSYYIYEKIIKEAWKHPDKNYFVLVPEQFTMQTQKTIVEMHPGKGILNIDVLSFERLAYRIFEEVGGDERIALEETGKSLVLQKLVQENREKLPYFGNQMGKPGYLAQVKSLISEFMQYDVDAENMQKIVEDSKNRALLYHKMQDMQVLYTAYRDFLKGHYMTGEEVLDILCQVISDSKKIRGSVLVLDSYTGFTPIQNRLLACLLALCERVYVTVTLDAREDPYLQGSPYSLFSMSKKMIQKLVNTAREVKGCVIEEPVRLKAGGKSRFARNEALSFLEQNLFRYRQQTFTGKQKAIRIYAASNPREEMEETARKILELVREENFLYREISIVAGNLQEYASVTRQVFEDVGIPCFIDEKHSVLMNPFVEYIRAAMNLAVENYSYESVFRYLRCGMGSFSREEIDRLENYAVALGIRGKKKWREVWTRLYRGMKPEEISLLNELRKRFVEETEPLMTCFSGREKTVEEYTRGLYDFLVKGNAEEKLRQQEALFHERGNLAMEKEYTQIYGIVMELLDRMTEILGKEKVKRQEYQQLLETGLSEAEVALIPPSADQVLVGDIERTRLKGVKVLFLVGVNDGNIPKNTEAGGILTELDREFLEERGTELAPGPRELTAQQRFYLYLNLTKPSHRLFLSYSLSSAKGEPLSPAYLIGTLQKLFPGLSVEEAHGGEAMSLLQHPGTSLEYFLKGLKAEGERDPVWRELYSWYLENPEYGQTVRRLVQAAFVHNPGDRISAGAAKALYGQISPYGATKLEKYAACAFAHFLQYGLGLAEREEYEFKPMDMGNVVHKALESFSQTLQREGKQWRNLTDSERSSYVQECLANVTADYGNTILHSTARNEFLITRVGDILEKTVWALQQQLQRGSFEPEGFEVSLAGGRIDRVDVYENEDKVYVKIIDYKTGNTSFDLVALYHGLQLQLVVYLNGAMEAEKTRHPGKEIIPAGIFYYNVKDPLVAAEIEEDLSEVEKKVLKELRMKGMVLAEKDTVQRLDSTLETIPVSYNKDGSLRRGSSVADREQFTLLSAYVKKKIEKARGEILEGHAEASPYQLGTKKACTYCPYMSVCGFDQKIPGYEFRRLARFSDEEIWKLMKEDM